MFQFMFIVQLLVKFKFFIQELWERKSLQILYECWRRAYHALLAQLFITLWLMITWVVFLRMFLNFISSLPVKRGGSLSFFMIFHLCRSRVIMSPLRMKGDIFRLFEICFHFAGHRSSTQEFSAGPSEFLPDLHFLCKIVLKPSNVTPLLLF
jgi:hypothetical protein